MRATFALRLQRRLTHTAVVLAAASLASSPVWAAPQSDVSDAFSQLGRDAIQTRVVSLEELGIHTSVTLNAPDTTREFFLPVPAGVPISDATLQLNGGYVRGDGGRTTMLVSLDGSPVLARSFTQADGTAAANVGVDGAARDSGYVRVGIGYASVINDNVCTDQTAIGNVLRIDPSTRLTYRFNPADVRDLRTAWSALPHEPVVAIASTRLQAATYDTAWRVSALLERDSKQPVVQAVPSVGEAIAGGTTTSNDGSGANASVPPALRVIPAFDAIARALSAQGSRIADPAQAGALIALAPHTIFGPDVMVVDDAMRTSIHSSLDALRAQIAAAAPDALTAFDDWRHRSIDPVVAPLATGEVRLVHYGTRTVIVVGDNRGLAVLAQGWRPIDVSNRLVVHEAGPGARTTGDMIRLSDLGGEPRSVDVHDTASWEARFDMAAASANGKLPADVVLDLAASPTLSNGGASATVYMNDVMIGAKLLNVDGKRQRIDVPIPRYALARTNTLRATFRRQPDAGCQARQSYPVAVLPSSFLRLASGTPQDDFVGMAMRYASAAQVIVPQAYLDDALHSVPRVATLSGATGVAPLLASFSVIPNGGTAKPDGAFLAADVGLDDEKDHAVFTRDHLALTSESGDRLIDVSGLRRVAVLSVARSGEQAGIVYRSTGDEPVLTDRLQLSRGDISIVDASGELRHFDTVHPDDLADADAQSGSSVQWVTRHWMRWAIPAALLVLLIIVVIAARHTRRKHRDTP